MRWTLAGCYGLALITLSVGLQISQRPRFYGVKVGQLVPIYCKSSGLDPNRTVYWYKADKYDTKKIQIQEDERIHFQESEGIQNAFLLLKNLQIEDSGVYFCKRNSQYGPGTALQVVRNVDPFQAQYRSQMKDGLMVLQGLVLATCVAAILLRKQQLHSKRRDSLYEEPENDHIYEGLAIETCGGELYEELSAYAQPEGAEAPWE
ncbi:uncharacterized protein cd79b [Nematolebias whitei]|uniref:uncharacterized protein cd79b n=1 Tax=Nematolebias whitei TaxID=451745 RepID=UPI00189A878F|nr:uncharacterized protein cd79b [Nematolebias whitei]